MLLALSVTSLAPRGVGTTVVSSEKQPADPIERAATMNSVLNVVLSSIDGDLIRVLGARTAATDQLSRFLTERPRSRSRGSCASARYPRVG